MGSGLTLLLSFFMEKNNVQLDPIATFIVIIARRRLNKFPVYPDGDGIVINFARTV